MRFPISKRVCNLKARALECNFEYESAVAAYEGILAIDEINQRAYKGSIACANAVGDDKKARELLTQYCETFGADPECWIELGAIYASDQAYDKALFCYEEVLLAMPHSAAVHRRVADVFYTIGGERALRQAKDHYAASLEFSTGKDVRSLYGVILCSKVLQRIKSSGGVEQRAKLAETAVNRLLQSYVAENESMLSLVRPQIQFKP
jgi:tetratricopeptide (TPR) repeat protein